MIITRFAPSPTGYLHLGHAFSALFAHEAAQRDKGTFLLRIEDIDPVRCKPEFTDAIIEDLAWLGLVWQAPVRKQSEHMKDYAVALDVLRDKGVLYPCFCTRREIAEEAAAATHAPHLSSIGPDGPVYGGTCRDLLAAERDEKLAQFKTVNWRLDVHKARSLAGSLFWNDYPKGWIEAKPQAFGDVVLARKDVPTSYHLSVTVDDHLQGITLVTRGDDLLHATDIHRLLQALLGYETPNYRHHALLTDADGKRLAKRNKAITLRGLREEGKTVDAVKAMISKNYQ